MAALTQRILEDTQNLLRLYNESLRFRTAFNTLTENPAKAQQVTYKGRPLKVYIDVIGRVSENYARGSPFFKTARRDLTQTGTMFVEYWKVKKDGEFTKAIKNFREIYNPEELKEIQPIEESRFQEKKTKWLDYAEKKEPLIIHPQKVYPQVDHVINEASKHEETFKKQPPAQKITDTSTKTSSSKKAFTPPRLPRTPAKAIRKFTAPTVNLAKRITIRFAPRLVGPAVGGTIGGVVGFAVSQGPAGAVIGAAGGATFSTVIKNPVGRAILGGAGKAVFGLGGKGALAAAGLATGPPGWVLAALTLAPKLKPVIKYAAIVITAIFLLPFFTDMLLKPQSVIGPGGVAESAPLPSQPPSKQLLQLTKTAFKEGVSVGDNIDFTIKVSSNALAGSKVNIKDKIPSGATFVSADEGGVLNGDTVSWDLDATKVIGGDYNVIPPQGQPAPPGFGRPVQRVSVTVDQIRDELQKNGSPYVGQAQAVYNAGVKHNVDPAFIMAIWRMENLYGKVGVLTNNPGSIVYVRDGYLGGMKKGVYTANRWFATWDTYEQGIEAIALLISTEYYSQGQTDTWTIHSGINGLGQHAYHCQCDIGSSSIKSWTDYVNFYYNWLKIMDQISGGSGYSISKEVRFTVKTTDDRWITNQAQAFAPGTGNINSNSVRVKSGNPSAPPPSQGSFTLSCPIANESIASSSFFDQSSSRRHCDSSTYVAMDACYNYPATYFGVDISTKNNKIAQIPYVTLPGETIQRELNCTYDYSSGPTCPDAGCESQYIVSYSCQLPGSDQITYLQYHHIKQHNWPRNLKSGDIIGDIADYNNYLRLLNIQVGVGGRCMGGTPGCVPNPSTGQTCGVPSCVPANEYIRCP